MFPDYLTTRATSTLAHCRERGDVIATAESCTGGMIAALLTEIAGSSDVVDRGFITYSNKAKEEVLGVESMLIAGYGAVSEPVACAMAQGALVHSDATIAVSCTGIAGPGGGSDSKPVGTVHIACARAGELVQHAHHIFDGDREAIRLATVEAALGMIMNFAAS